MSRTFTIKSTKATSAVPNSDVEPVALSGLPETQHHKSTVPVITLSGVAGTGKTTLTDMLQRKYPSQIAVAPSFTRRAYHLLGIATETDMTKLPLDVQAEHQVNIFELYCTLARQFVQQQTREPDVKAIVLQRSPFDHLAYINTYVGIELTNAAQLVRMTKTFLKNINPYTVVLPYPAPWHLNNAQVLNDAFRDVNHTTYDALALDLTATVARYRDSLVQPAQYIETFDLSKRVTFIEDLIESHWARNRQALRVT